MFNAFICLSTCSSIYPFIIAKGHYHCNSPGITDIYLKLSGLQFGFLWCQLTEVSATPSLVYIDSVTVIPSMIHFRMIWKNMLDTMDLICVWMCGCDTMNNYKIFMWCSSLFALTSIMPLIVTHHKKSPQYILLLHLLLHWGKDKMTAILQMTLSIASWKKIFVFWSKFQWTLFLRVRFKMSSYLNQCCLSFLLYICITWPQ